MWINPWAKSEKPKLRQVHIIRTETSDEGTFGDLWTGALFERYTGEPPWRNNAKGKSCILPKPGEKKILRVEWALSPKYGGCYHIRGTDGREHCLFHAGNWCGDEEKGLKSNTDGCILLGNSIGEIAGQKALLSSRDAIAAFVEEMEREPFELHIRWKDGLAP